MGSHYDRTGTVSKHPYEFLAFRNKFIPIPVHIIPIGKTPLWDGIPMTGTIRTGTIPWDRTDIN